MAATNGAIITSKGQELIADSQANQIPIEWTKMSIGGGVLNSNPEDLNDLINKIMDIDVTSITKDGKAFTIRGNFTNVGFTQDTDFREIGLYAKTTNSPECLYAYVNAGGGEVIPAESSGRIQRVLDVVSTIGNGLDITFNIDSSLFATIYDLEEGLALKEPKFTKNGGFNREKTDSVTTDSSVILATAKAIKTVWDTLTNHRNSTSNPHTVTKSQVGLGNVPNYTITDSTTDGSSSKFGSAKAIKTVWDKVLEAIGFTNTNKNAIQNNQEQIENLNARVFLYKSRLATGSLNDVVNLTESLMNFNDVEITVGEYNGDNDSRTVSTIGIEVGHTLEFRHNDNNGGTVGNDNSLNYGIVKVVSETELQIIYHSLNSTPKTTSSYYRIKKVIGKGRIR